MLVVTACNRRYFHGVRVLWNSFQKHSAEGNEFWCLVFGDEELQNDLMALGINIMPNPQYPVGVPLTRALTWLNTERYDDDAIKALYSRILLPALFPNSKRVLWVDADANFLGSVSDLDNFNMQGNCVAAPLTNKLDGVHKAQGQSVARGQHIRTGTMLFDTQLFNKQGWLEKCFDVMEEQTDKIDGSAIEFVVNWVLRFKATDLPKIYSFDGKKDVVTKSVRLIHWSIMEPWNPKMMEEKPQNFKDKVEKYWRPYDY
jgi:lipopolysaccharide biosynthesis glycosyltransferase